jgi:ABC-type Fe3+ transport system permease subunit
MRITKAQYLSFHLSFLTGSTFAIILIAQGFIYWIENPIFEQYKVQKDREWPWKLDPKGWNSVLKNAILYNIINLFITNFVGVNLYAWSLNWKLPMNFDLDAYPGNWEIFK